LRRNARVGEQAVAVRHAPKPCDRLDPVKAVRAEREESKDTLTSRNPWHKKDTDRQKAAAEGETYATIGIRMAGCGIYRWDNDAVYGGCRRP
jgi:hypothetical protein